MASMTAAACGCGIASSAAAGPSGRVSSHHSALKSSSSSSPSLLQAGFPFKYRVRLAPSLRSLDHGPRFGRSPVALSGDAVSRAGIARASSRGDDNNNRDDAGVIKDMELYLDDLSLEYDSVWDTKPAWCQPWTIVGTGVGVITASWLPFHNAFLTGGVSLLIGFWWYSFLYVYPLGYSEMIAERRRMVENGSEDTYGRKRQ